ncbi:MAG: SRPBCC family protein [Polyangiales bacterium]
MTKRQAHHDTFVIERTYPSTPARVFAAWSNPKSKARWFVGPDEWTGDGHSLDFRVGGKERVAGGPKGGPVHTYEAVIQDIVPDQRIVSTYVMHIDDTRMSVSIATLELEPAGKGTRMKYTEQAVFLDGTDSVASREEGTRALFDNLEAWLRDNG